MIRRGVGPARHADEPERTQADAGVRVFVEQELVGRRDPALSEPQNVFMWRVGVGRCFSKAAAWSRRDETCSYCGSALESLDVRPRDCRRSYLSSSCKLEACRKAGLGFHPLGDNVDRQT